MSPLKANGMPLCGYCSRQELQVHRTQPVVPIELFLKCPECKREGPRYPFAMDLALQVAFAIACEEATALWFLEMRVQFGSLPFLDTMDRLEADLRSWWVGTWVD